MRLIADDLDISLESAWETMAESREAGFIVNCIDNDEEVDDILKNNFKLMRKTQSDLQVGSVGLSTQDVSTSPAQSLFVC